MPGADTARTQRITAFDLVSARQKAKLSSMPDGDDAANVDGLSHQRMNSVASAGGSSSSSCSSSQLLSEGQSGADATSAGGGAGSYSGEYGRLFADVRPRKACACSNSPASGHEVPVTAHATGDVTLVTRGGRPVLQLAARDN